MVFPHHVDPPAESAGIKAMAKEKSMSESSEACVFRPDAYE
jgi:hypothetical protein